MDWSFLQKFVNTSKVAGWARAGTASILAAAIAKWPLLGQYLDPSAQTALGIVASSIAVGIWSHLAKTSAGKK